MSTSDPVGMEDGHARSPKVGESTGDLDYVWKVVETVDQYLYEMAVTYLKRSFQ